MIFSDLVEEIKVLSFEEKKEIQLLLTQYLREENRQKIDDNFQIAKREEKTGKLKFSSDINELKNLMEEE